MHNHPFVVHIPHCGTKIPNQYMEDYYLELKELRENIFQYADFKTDELYAPLVDSFAHIINPYSRLFMDPERFFDDTQEQMQVKYRLGWFYENAILEKKPLRSTRNKEKIKEYYIKHHSELLQKVDAQLMKHQACTIIDCHSFSNERYWFHDASLKMPDICIGFDEYHKDEKLTEAILKEFEGFDVGINTPYSGSLVPLKYFMKNQNVKSVMIEVNKKLYLESDNCTKNSQFDTIKQKFKNIFENII